MVDCSVCDPDEPHEAVMFCANCGKAVCEGHTIEGRYCSKQCHEEHEQETEDFSEEHKSIRGIRGKRAKILLAIMAIVVFIVVYALLGAFGVQT